MEDAFTDGHYAVKETQKKFTGIWMAAGHVTPKVASLDLLGKRLMDHKQKTVICGLEECIAAPDNQCKKSTMFRDDSDANKLIS